MNFKMPGGVYGWIISSLLILLLILGGLLGWANYKIEKQKNDYRELELRLEKILAAGQAPPPVWTNPFPGFDPSSPTQTPTEQNYSQTVNEFKEELKGMKDEEVFITYAGIDGINYRNELVANYSTELESSLRNKISNPTD